MTRPVRPLVIAEMANPEWVSVPLEGWSLSQALRETGGAHVVTQVRNREAFLRAGMREGDDFTAIDTEAVTRPIWRAGQALRMGKGKGWTTVMLANAVSYPFFERQVWQTFSGALKAGEYDLVHRVTPLSPTISSPIASRCAKAGIPFVMGPMNGGLPWPRHFDAERRREREFLSYVRGAYKILPGRNRTLHAANAIIAGSQHTLSEIPQKHREKCVYIPENGVDLSKFSPRAPRTPDGPLRGVFIGRLVPYKCPDVLIEAAAPLLSDGKMTLDFCGDGPMMESLRSQADALGVTKQITFHGHVPHAALQDILAEADLFTFPSIREFGGAVVIEAMALGIVPLIVDYGGPGEHVTPETGFTVPMGSRQEIMSAFRSRLERIIADPGQLAAMAQAGRARVEDRYDWTRKALQVREVYDWVLGHSPRPAPCPL
ncbi:MAG: glycosyltransferase family 4 protein [Pseudomonadota bacterium]